MTASRLSLRRKKHNTRKKDCRDTATYGRQPFVFPGLCPGPYSSDLQSRMARQVPRMPWHPVPRRAFCTYLQYRLLMTCSRFISFAYLTCGRLIKLRVLISYAFYKETTVGFDCLFWLHQWGIPRHTCRFHCCLAAHQRTRKKDSAEPSFPILWTPPHPPGVSAAAGHFGCRGLGTI